jgi:hypothetical protein
VLEDLLKEAWKKRDRTFLFLIPPEKYARQRAFVDELRPAVTIVDWRANFLQSVLPKQRYLNLTVQSELSRLKDLSVQHKNKYLCMINTEYALMRFKPDERETFWRGLWTDFPYSDSVIIYTVLNTLELLPQRVEFEQWEANGRVLCP